MFPRAELRRLDNWEERLIELVRDRRLVRYAYGTNDCATFVHDAVETMTGVSLYPGPRPQGWVAAAKFLIGNGWEDVEQMATALLGPPMVDPAQSGRGDVVSFEDGGEFHLAIRVGDHAMTPTPIGLVVVEKQRWRLAWRVG